MRTQRCPYPFLLKPFGIRLPPICCATIALAVATELRASLIPIVFVDTPTQLAILWDWDEFGAGGVQVADLNIPPLVNWHVELSTTPAAPIPTWTVEIDVFHITNPHPGDVGGGNLTTLTKVFADNLFLGLPVLPNVVSVADHPAIGHFDTYEMQVFHSTTGTTNTVKLFGEHVPEPNTLGLLAVCSLMLVRRWRRSTKRRL